MPAAKSSKPKSKTKTQPKRPARPRPGKPAIGTAPIIEKSRFYYFGPEDNINLEKVASVEIGEDGTHVVSCAGGSLKAIIPPVWKACLIEQPSQSGGQWRPNNRVAGFDPAKSTPNFELKY